MTTRKTKPRKRVSKVTTGWMLEYDWKPECFDERLPIYWWKYIAEAECRNRCLDDVAIVRVEIRRAKPRGGRGGKR